MKRHEYSKSILAYLNYELVVIHGINCTVYYVAVRSTRFRLQLLSQKKKYISTLVSIWRQKCFQFLNRYALYISSILYMVVNFQHNTVVINKSLEQLFSEFITPPSNLAKPVSGFNLELVTGYRHRSVL